MVAPIIDDSPLVQLRAPRVSFIDRDSDGTPDVYLFDVNGDDVPDIEHHVADRRTVVLLQRQVPWEPAPTVTAYTGEADEVPLRVCFRVKRIGELAWELNGVPMSTCVASMLSMGLVWTAERERRNEVDAARLFLLMNGGAGLYERI